MMAKVEMMLIFTAGNAFIFFKQSLIRNREQSYFCKLGTAEVDIAALTAVRSKRRGVFMYTQSGAVNVRGCRTLQTNRSFTYSPLYSEEAWTPEGAGLKPWKPKLEDVVAERNYITTHSGSD